MNGIESTRLSWMPTTGRSYQHNTILPEAVERSHALAGRVLRCCVLTYLARGRDAALPCLHEQSNPHSVLLEDIGPIRLQCGMEYHGPTCGLHSKDAPPYVWPVHSDMSPPGPRGGPSRRCVAVELPLHLLQSLRIAYLLTVLHVFL
jgi:hypothetical protein